MDRIFDTATSGSVRTFELSYLDSEHSVVAHNFSMWKWPTAITTRTGSARAYYLVQTQIFSAVALGIVENCLLHLKYI